MRITAEAKAETRERIIRGAARLFQDRGWEATTTRAIATAAGIASGTLFNYFQSKESIVAVLVADALEDARDHLHESRGKPKSLEEALFSLIWAELGSLGKYRKFLPEALDAVLGPLRGSSMEASGEAPGAAIRANHLEVVEQILVRQGVPAPLPLVTMELYWMLYLGVFAFWSRDDSPHQEDTLALLDQTLKLFVTGLPTGRTPAPVD